MRFLLFIFLFYVPAAWSCEALPNPYVQLSYLDKDFKGYATLKDYKAYYKTTVDFDQYDVNKDSVITVDEVHQYQKNYQKRCQALQ